MTFNTSGMIRNLRTDRGRLRWAPGPGSWARPVPGSLPSWEGQAGGGGQPGLVAGASRTAQQWARGVAREGWRVDVLGWAGERAKELRAPGLREAGAARPPAGGPVATVAAATTLQAVVVIHVTAAANTVQLTGAKLHALHIHFLLRVVRGDGGARAVRAHALQALHGQLLQAPLQEAVLPLQLLLDAQRPAVLLLQFLGGGGCEP